MEGGRVEHAGGREGGMDGGLDGREGGKEKRGAYLGRWRGGREVRMKEEGGDGVEGREGEGWRERGRARGREDIDKGEGGRLGRESKPEKERGREGGREGGGKIESEKRE